MFSGFSGSSAGEESICNAGDPSSVPESGRYPGEGIGYPLQYSQDFLEIQMVKNPQEAWVQEVPLEEGVAIHSSIIAWGIPRDRGAWWAPVHKVAKSWTRLSNLAHTRCVFMSFNLYHCWYMWFLKETLKYLESSKAVGLFAILLVPTIIFHLVSNYSFCCILKFKTLICPWGIFIKLTFSFSCKNFLEEGRKENNDFFAMYPLLSLFASLYFLPFSIPI